MEHRAKHTTKKSESGFLPPFLKSSVIGAASGLLCALLLLLFGTFACLCVPNPHAWITPIGIAILYLSAIVGGVVAIRHHKEASLLCGVFCGAWMLLVFCLVALIPSIRGGFSLGISLLLRGLIPVFSLIGARLGAKRKTVRRRRK